jgi:hypothetical protein
MQNDILKNSAFESCKLSNAALQVRLRQKLAITALRSAKEDLRKRGNLVFWRTAAQEIQCGIVLNDKTSVLRLDGNSTEKLPLPKEVIGVADARGLLEKGQNRTESVTDYGMLYALSYYYYPIHENQTVRIIDGDSFGQGDKTSLSQTTLIPLGRCESLSKDEYGILYSLQTQQQILVKRDKILASEYLIKKEEVKHFFKFSKALGKSIIKIVEQLNELSNTSNFDEKTVEHGLLEVRLPNTNVLNVTDPKFIDYVLKLESGLPVNGGSPSTFPIYFDKSSWGELETIKTKYVTSSPSIWRTGTKKINGTQTQITMSPTKDYYQRIKVIKQSTLPIDFKDGSAFFFTLNAIPNNSLVFDNREECVNKIHTIPFTDEEGIDVYIKRYFANFRDTMLIENIGLVVAKNIFHSHPNSAFNLKLIGPSASDYKPSDFALNLDGTQIMYHPAEKDVNGTKIPVNGNIVFYAIQKNIQDALELETEAIVNNYAYYNELNDKVAAVVAIPYTIFQQLLVL